jgi:hypothetical protein
VSKEEKRQPYMKFYCSDWRGDPRLRMCSLAARGLWIDLMSYAHEGDPYGHVTIDGKVPDLAGIAALVARPLKEVKAAIAELEERNVFSRADNGAVYSRRMVRDKAKAERDKQNGKAGGNPNLKPPDNGGVNPPDKLIPTTRDQKEDFAPVGAPTKYFFESGVIRLTEKDFRKWQEAFSNLDLRAELIGLTQWADQQKDWFFAVSGALAKRNREIGLALKSRPIRPADRVIV